MNFNIAFKVRTELKTFVYYNWSLLENYMLCQEVGVNKNQPGTRTSSTVNIETVPISFMTVDFDLIYFSNYFRQQIWGDWLELVAIESFSGGELHGYFEF